MKGAFFDLTTTEKVILDLIVAHDGPLSGAEIINGFPADFFNSRTRAYAVLQDMIDAKGLLSSHKVLRKAPGEHAKRREYALTAHGTRVHTVSEMVAVHMAPPRTRAKKKTGKKTR